MRFTTSRFLQKNSILKFTENTFLKHQKVVSHSLLGILQRDVVTPIGRIVQEKYFYVRNVVILTVQISMLLEIFWNDSSQENTVPVTNL